MGFFKAYDMRGTFGIDFDLALVEKVGYLLPGVIGHRILVGRDTRLSSPAVHDALVRGLTASGAEVHDLGLCTTPMVYFFTAEDDYTGSVMITASHNPPGDNGLKVSKRTALPVGYRDGLDRIEREVVAMHSKGGGGFSPARAVLKEPPPQVTDALPRYLDWMRARKCDLSGLRFAVDCSNGMASLLVHELFPEAETVLNDTLDGSFPAHSPNPLKAEAREQLAAVVREKGLDCGVIFDGDADRCMFVDETGRFIQPDYLIPFVVPLANRTVIHDVRTSRGTTEYIRRAGGTPRMVPVGHAFAKPLLREYRAVGGGELAGHYYFAEFHGCDSGALAAMRILGAVADAKRRGERFSEMMAPIMNRYANSGEINFRVDDKDGAMKRAADWFRGRYPGAHLETMDGLRFDVPEGWISVRKSNTEPYLRLLAEAVDRPMLEDWVAHLTEAIDAR